MKKVFIFLLSSIILLNCAKKNVFLNDDSRPIDNTVTLTGATEPTTLDCPCGIGYCPSDKVYLQQHPCVDTCNICPIDNGSVATVQSVEADLLGLRKGIKVQGGLMSDSLLYKVALREVGYTESISGVNGSRIITISYFEKNGFNKQSKPLLIRSLKQTTNGANTFTVLGDPKLEVSQQALYAYSKYKDRTSLKVLVEQSFGQLSTLVTINNTKQ